MARVVLGTDVETGQQVWIDDIARQSGCYLSGRPGVGKSAEAVNMGLQDIAHGHGLFFLDPHGDALVDLARRLSSDRLKQAYLFNIEDDDYSFGINLLSCKDVSSLGQRERTYARAFNVFAKIWDRDENWGVWLQLILQNLLRAFIENQDYSLADVPMFLNPANREFREHIINNIRYSPEVADFWRYEFFDSRRREPEQQARLDSTLTRINTLLTNPYVRDIVGQQASTIDFEKLVSSQDIFLFNLPANLAEDQKQFIGTILISELLHAVRARREGERDQFCLFIDEFHNYASNTDMATMVTEGRKFGLASTFMHVERFGQLANNPRLMGATAATVNKVFFQQTVKDAEEFAPEFAKEVEPTEIRREAELVLSPNPIEDIWERGHPHEDIMWLRGRFFWILQLSRSQPYEKYFIFDPSRSAPEYRYNNPLLFRAQEFSDWDYYRSSADMIRQAISLWNQYLFDWMRGKYSVNMVITDEQMDTLIEVIECLGGVLGFLPMMQPYISMENRQRLIYLIYQRFLQDDEREQREKIQVIRNEIQYLKDHGVKEEHLGSASSGISSPIPMHGWVGSRGNTTSSVSRAIIGYKRGTKEDFDKQEKHLKGLWQQIQILEQSQPREYPSLLILDEICREIHDFKTLASIVGMPSYEVEELIEWEVNPFTFDEASALRRYIWETYHRHYRLARNKNNSDEPYSGTAPLVASSLFYDRYTTFKSKQVVSKNKEDLLRKEEAYRSNWQNKELYAFIELFLCDEPRILLKDPIKVPSGKYTETLRVERPQHDLVTDMVLELTRLPRFTAYAKISQSEDERQSINTYKMETHELPDVCTSDGDVQAMANANKLSKTREEIHAEIRARKSRWQGGNNPPTGRERRD